MASTIHSRARRAGLGLALSLLASACAAPGETTSGTAGKETVLAVTASNTLVRFDAGRPGSLVSSHPLVGLRPGETVLGMDHRPSDRRLYAVGSSNRLYRIDPAGATATPVGEPFTVALSGTAFGVAFDPVSGRLVVIGDTGQRLRIDADLGTVVDGDDGLPGLQTGIPSAYAAGDMQAGQRPALVATAFGSAPSSSSTAAATQFALDAAWGMLVTIGPSGMADEPALPGRASLLHTVGELGTGGFERAAFDIARKPRTGYAAITPVNAGTSNWVVIDLGTGTARSLGRIGGTEAVRAVAILP
jgi:hypothetical protein